MKYGLIGEKLVHSFSKEIHERAGGYPYRLLELSPGELDAFMKKKDFLGINVTIPYKEKVIPFLDMIESGAKKIGAVNTVVNEKGKLCGYNTDYPALLSLLKKNGIDAAGKKALILGTGGTSRTAYQALCDAGAREIIKVSRSEKDGCVTYKEAYRLHSDAEIIVNATPCGMFPHNGEKPIEISAFPRLAGYCDAIYNPLRSRAVTEALAAGIPACGGLYMLVMQAILASALFQKKSPDTETADKIYAELLAKKENIVLTGMPGSGKSTIGRLTAKRLERKFYDTDVLIVQKAGMSIPEYFEKYGEAEFRKVEKEVIAELSSVNGAVIATGGGAVLDPENILALKENGRTVFIDRPLDKIRGLSGRPLSSSPEMLKKRYEERYGIYLSTADTVLPAVEDLETNVKNLIKAVKK